MNHPQRTYQIVNQSLDIHEDELRLLAQQLVYGTWTCCSAFRCGPLLLVNDSCAESEGQVYAIFRVGDEAGYEIGELRAAQIQTLCFSNLTLDEARQTLFDLARMASQLTPSGIITLHLEHTHHRCSLCA